MPNDFLEFDSLEEARAALAASQPASKKPYGRSVVETIYPGVSVTSSYRGPNHPLSKKNPNSFHARGDKAVDVRAIPGMTFNDYLDGINKAGYDILEYRNEYINPSPDSTGPHWHVVIGDKREKNFQEFDTLEEAQAALQQTPQAAPQAEKKEPWKPTTFNQEVAPKAQLSEAEIGNVNYETDYVLNDDQEFAVRDIQNRLFAARGKKSGQKIIDGIKRDYGRLFPNMTDDDLRYAVQYYQNGGKAPVDFFSSGTNMSESTAKPGDTVVKAPPPLSPVEVGVKKAEEMYGDTGRGVNAALGRQLAKGLMTEDDFAAYMRDVENRRGAEERFWGDQGERTENPILDAAAGFVGEIVGDINPTYLIAPGQSAAGRILGQGLVNAATDVPTQLMEMDQGLQKEYNPTQTAVNFAAGAAFQGVFEGLGKLASSLGKKVEVEADGTPYVDVPSPEGLVRVYDPSKPISRKAQLKSTTAAAATAPVSAVPNPVEVPRNTSWKAKENVDAAVATVTGEWKAAPEFTTYGKFADLPDKEKIQIVQDTEGRPEDVKAWTDKDGKVHIIADHLDGPEDIPAIAFHEALGHVGLSRQFGARLDRVLEDAYRTNDGLREKVDAWFAEGGRVPDSADSPTARATEEVLAEASELGKIDASLFDKVKNILKDYARRVGIKLSYSDREIRTILAMAHSRVTNGGGITNPGASGNKYIRVYHGSAADFDKFDLKYLGTGEGAQVFGHGLYFTETRDIADQYRRKLSDAYTVTIPDSDYPGNRVNLSTDGLIRRVEGLDSKLQGAIHSLYLDMKNGFRLEEAAEGRKNLAGNKPEYSELIEEAKTFLKDLGAGNNQGRLYEVDLPDDMHWLAWDFQPTDAQKAKLKDLGIEYGTQAELRQLYGEYYTAQQKMLDAEDALQELKEKGLQFSEDATEGQKSFGAGLTPEYAKELAKLRDAETAVMFLQHEIDNASPSGDILYKKLSAKLGGDAQASKALKDAGFDGIKFLDGFSRDYGEGSHNYVVFDDNHPKIVNKYVRKKPSPTSEKGKEKSVNKFVNNINLDNLKSSEDIAAVMKAVEKEIPKTRVSHDEVKAFADANGMSFKDVRDWASDNGGARLLAMRRVLVQSGERVMKIVRAIDEGDNSDINLRVFAQRMATHRLIQDSVSRAISEAGRVLNALKITAESNRGDLDALRYVAKKTGVEILESKGGLEALAKTIALHADNPAAVNKIVDDAFNPLPEDYILSFRYNMMLYGLGTHVKNALGNAGLTYTDLIEHGLASVIGQRKRFASTPDRVSAREVLSRQMGIFQALTEWGTYTEAMKSYKEGKPTHSVSKVEVGQNLFTKKFGAPGQALEVPTRLLSMSDSFFRSLLEQSSYNGLAHRIAISENLKGQDYLDRVADLQKNPTDGMKAMADAHAALTQLVDEPSIMGKVLENIKSRPKNRKNYGARALRFAFHMITPFSRVTDRLFWMAMRRTPIVGFLDRVNREDWAAGGARRDLVLARMALGAAVIGFMTMKFQDGELSGNGPTNYDKKAQMEAEGWQPNSIKFGDTWYSTHFGETMQDKDFKDADEVTKVFELMAAGANAFVDNTFAEQIASVFAMVGKGGLAENARENYLTNMEKSFIPAGVRQSAEIADGKVRDATGDGTIGGKLKGGLKTSTPGLRDELPIRHDVYGREIDSNRNIFAVFMSKTESKDPIVNEIKRLSKVNDDKPLVTPSGRKSLEASLKVKKLDASIIQEYQKLAGTYIYESLKENINSPEWKEMTDEERIKLVKKITTAQRKFAREDLFDGLDSEKEGDNDE
jgi:hypothetical protein